MKITAFEYRQQTRQLRKQLAKAIRQHKKRSHIRKAQDELFARWAAKFGMGVISFLLTRTMHKRRRRIREAVSQNNAFMDFMRRANSVKSINGARIIGGSDGN